MHVECNSTINENIMSLHIATTSTVRVATIAYYVIAIWHSGEKQGQAHPRTFLSTDLYITVTSSYTMTITLKKNLTILLQYSK